MQNVKILLILKTCPGIRVFHHQLQLKHLSLPLSRSTLCGGEQQKWNHCHRFPQSLCEGRLNRICSQYLKVGVQAKANTWLAVAGLQCRRGVPVQVWLSRWRQRSVQRSHWCGGRCQWKHHCGWLGKQQDTGIFLKNQAFVTCCGFYCHACGKSIGM